MADINKSDIKLMQSQRLDDTDQGGGQMTSSEVVDGQVNNLFPDISRLDRVYGRVSMRKAYMAVQTSARETYYGSHTIMTEQVKDPNVSVSFFSNKDWFGTREEARDRIESYLVKGPLAQMSLWGNHYKGTSALLFFTSPSWPTPEIGDVLVILNEENEQYVRVIESNSEIRTFYDSSGSYTMKIVFITIGTQLLNDFIGKEVGRIFSATDDKTKTYETVAADASRYYGVATISEDAKLGDLQVRVSDINTSLVPSASSETAITDSGVGTSSSPLIQTRTDTVSVVRTMQYNISTNSALHIGEGIKPGTFSWSGGITLEDDLRGNILYGSKIVGSISYATGIIIFGNVATFSGVSGVATYVPACSIQEFSQTGAIAVELNNRGFVYVYNCNPLPRSGSVKIDYLSGGKWYSMWDTGNGQLAGSDESIGSGSINSITGSLSITLGAMPDVGSSIIIYWSKVEQYYDLSGETLPLSYILKTEDEAIARTTFVLSWAGDLISVYETGDGVLYMASRALEDDEWTKTEIVAGFIMYSTGDVVLEPSGLFTTPSISDVFKISYNHGEKIEESFPSPQRNDDGTITIDIVNTPIIPGTLSVEWNNEAEDFREEKTTVQVTVKKKPVVWHYAYAGNTYVGGKK